MRHRTPNLFYLVILLLSIVLTGCTGVADAPCIYAKNCNGTCYITCVTQAGEIDKVTLSDYTEEACEIQRAAAHAEWESKGGSCTAQFAPL